MQRLIYLAGKAVRRGWGACVHPLHNLYARWLLYSSGALCGRGLRSFGIPDVRISRGRHGGAVPCRIGREFAMRNGSHGVSRSSQRCLISVDRDGALRIGDRVGISNAVIICTRSVTIGDDVKAGFGVHIMDTDFHALDPEDRRGPHDMLLRRCAPVSIGNNVFIGAGTFILKGVSIGDNAVIGARSVVARSIPANEIWAGNPARRLRRVGEGNVSPVTERRAHASS